MIDRAHATVPVRVSDAQADVSVARALVREYVASWGADQLEDPELIEELEHLALRYGPPAGRILVAWAGEEPAGVACLRALDETTCVMKRMYVRPAHRRLGLARSLAARLIEEARGIGYRRMVLDTPQDNHPALRLYRSLGFEDCEPFLDPAHGHVHDDFAALALPLTP